MSTITARDITRTMGHHAGRALTQDDLDRLGITTDLPIVWGGVDTDDRTLPLAGLLSGVTVTLPDGDYLDAGLILHTDDGHITGWQVATYQADTNYYTSGYHAIEADDDLDTIVTDMLHALGDALTDTLDDLN